MASRLIPTDWQQLPLRNHVAGVPQTMRNIEMPRSYLSFYFAYLLATMLSAILGCGGVSQPKIAPVNGKLLFRGEPLVGATVVFIQNGAARHSFGVTDANGTFALSTYMPGDGALIGVNQVQVIPPSGVASEISGDVPTMEEYTRELRKLANSPRSVVPERYRDVATSRLSFTVVAGKNQLCIELMD